MSGPRLLNGLGDIISGGKELYEKIYHAMGGDNHDSYDNSGGGYGRSYGDDYDSYPFGSGFGNFGNFGARFDEFGYGSSRIPVPAMMLRLMQSSSSAPSGLQVRA